MDNDKFKELSEFAVRKKDRQSVHCIKQGGLNNGR